METLFELTFQDQTLNPQVGTFTDASQATGTFTLEDGEYYLTNGDTKGFYAYKPIALQSGSVDDGKVIIEFDLKVVTASANTHTIIATYAGVDGSGIPTGAKITLQYNAGNIELVLGGGATATLIESADVVVDQWYHFRIDCYLAAPLASTYQVKIDGVSVTTVTGATTDYELGIISVLGTDLHACDECGIKNITLVTETNMYVGRTALDQALQDVKSYVDSHNGVLTIQKNGSTVGTFSANQATNKTINIEVPDVNNGTLTIQKNGSTVGTFSANQATNKTINIGVPDVNNGTLTIQKNGSTVGTFSANQATNKTINIGVPDVNNGTLTIQKNGSTVGTFSANQATNKTINIEVSAALPIGSYIQFAGSQAPDGFLVCNGGAISRTTYSALFAVIGTTYGSGNGSTTFNLPNLTDRFLQGSTTSGTVKNAGLPNITGSYNSAKLTDGKDIATGAFVVGGAEERATCNAGNDSTQKGFSFNASHSSSIYGNSSTVQPPALTCLICIKY